MVAEPFDAEEQRSFLLLVGAGVFAAFLFLRFDAVRVFEGSVCDHCSGIPVPNSSRAGAICVDIELSLDALYPVADFIDVVLDVLVGVDGPVFCDFLSRWGEY